MWRNMLRTAAILLLLHSGVTMVFAGLVFPGSAVDRLAFAQHAFGFAFVALLNLAVFRVGTAPRWQRLTTHASNAIFLANCLLFSVLKPEPPTVTAAAIVVLMTVAALGRDREFARAT
jgi:hypothetical protein